MYSDPIYLFDDDNEIGYTNIPENSIVLVISDTTNSNLPILFYLNSKTNIGPTTTGRYILDNLSSNYKLLNTTTSFNNLEELEIVNTIEEHTTFTFTGKIFTKNNSIVFLNGIKIRKSNYNISNNGIDTTIEFLDGKQVNDVISVEYFKN